MKASKEIAKKAAEYQKLKGKVDDLYEELQEWAAERDFEDFYIHGFGVVSEPNGDDQSNGCYCDQVMLGRIMDREHIIFLSKAVRNICLLPIHFNLTMILLSEFDVEDLFFVDDEGNIVPRK